MPDLRSMAAQNTFLKKEAVPGTPEVTGFIGVPGLRMRPGYDGDRDIFRGGSGKVVTSTIGRDAVSPWETEMAACFNTVGLALASRFAIPTTTTPGGGTLSRTHVFPINPIAEDNAASYTAIWGDSFVGLRGQYGYFNNFGMDISRGEVKVSTNFRSRAYETGFLVPTNEQQQIAITGTPTGGTFTITFPFALGGSGTTAAIQYNAAASAVKSAIVAITGGKFTTDDIDVTGGPGPGTPYVLTFKGRYGQTNVAPITTTNSFTGGTSPNTTITEVTPGAKPTDIPTAPMPSKLWDLYIDPTWAALGSTQVGVAYSANLKFDDKFDEDAPLNSTIISYEKPLEKQEQDATADLILRLGATAIAQFANMDAGTKQFFRLELNTSRGANPYYIEGTIPYICRFDFCAEIMGRGAIDKAPNSSAVVTPLSLVMSKDPTTGNYAQATLQNTVTGY
jgi:hypothetical protein